MKPKMPKGDVRQISNDTPSMFRYIISPLLEKDSVTWMGRVG